RDGQTRTGFADHARQVAEVTCSSNHPRPGERDANILWCSHVQLIHADVIPTWPMSAFGGKADIVRRANLSSDLESSRERLATCCRPHGNRDSPTVLPLSIGRRERRPSGWLGWGVFSPCCRIR